MNPATSNRGRPVVRIPKARVAAGVFILTAAIVLSGIGQTLAERFPEDPVEKFKRALIVESAYRISTLQVQLDTAKDATQRKELEDTLKVVIEAHKKRMEDAARALTNLADLSRALFLLEWPPSATFERDAWQQIDDKVRSDMRDRLVNETLEGIEHGSDARKIALCQLTAESLVTAEDPTQEYGPVIVEALAKLQGPIASLFESTANDDVRVAAAIPLGRFVRQGDKVGPALGRVLAGRKRYSERSRRAAADALVQLMLYLTGEDVIRPSEPGVTPRETRRTRLRPLAPPAIKGRPLAEDLKTKKERDRTSYRTTLGTVASAVTKAAAGGATDPVPAIRATSVAAIRQAASATAYELRLMKDEARQLIDRYLSEYSASARDRDRKWTEWEKKQAKEQRDDLQAGLTGIRPALNEFTSKKVLAAMVGGLTDTDTATRVESRRALDELSRLRRFLIEYDAQIPAHGKEPTKETRRSTPGRPATTAAILRASGDATPGRGVPIVLIPAPPDRLPMVFVSDLKKEENDLSTLLIQLDNLLTGRRQHDPDPNARRLTMEAIEALGRDGLRFVPRLLDGLDDPNLFVRWVAARALKKLSLIVESEAPREGPAIVAGLIARLDDSDLDPRTEAVAALGAYGPLAKSAVGPLAGKLAKGDPDFRIAVLRALEAIGTDSAPALPTLAALFNDSDQRIRVEAARVVGRFGALAKDYLPGLERLVEDLDLDVRNAASAAILQITLAVKRGR